MPIRIGSISLYFPDCLFGEDWRRLRSGAILCWAMTFLNNPRNNCYGKRSNFPQRIQLRPKHQLGEFRCFCEVELCKSIILVVHICKQWLMKRHVSRWKTAPINTPVSTFWWSIILEAHAGSYLWRITAKGTLPPLLKATGLVWRRQFDATSHFSERFLFRTLFIPKGFHSKRSFLRPVFSPLIRKAYNPKGHWSENFNSEMPLFLTVFDTKGFYPEQVLIRTVLIPKGRFSEIRNKKLSDQEPFSLKNRYDVNKFS